MNVLVICGGGQSEHEVSLRSGKAVGAALQAVGHSVSFYDPAEDQGYKALGAAVANVDVVFPIVHGWGGEDGALQSALEALHVLYVGSDAAVSARCFNKLETLTVIQQAGIQVPATDQIGFMQLAGHVLLRRPFVLKPVQDGSSVGTMIVRNPTEFHTEAVRDIFVAHDDEMLIEELVVGVELTVAVLDTAPLPVIEIIPPADAEFDYENKYNGATQELCPPQHIPDVIQQEAQAIALKAHQTLGCRHLSRTDMIWNRERGLYYLETNTLPGMTDQSLFPRAARAGGIEMSELVDRLVRLAQRG